MMSPMTRAARLLCMACLACSPAAVLARTPGETEFARGYYLQMHEGDPAAAATAFEKVISDDRASAELRAEAKDRLAQCREDQAASDLAHLMPPDVIAYVEVTRPGQHLTRVVDMLGLVGTRQTAAEDGVPRGTPLPEGMFFPDDFAISPALLRAAGEVRGLAVALTDFDPRHGRPSGVLVLHPGDSDLIRGMVETAVQLLEPGEPMSGFRVYRGGEAWVTVTRRLMIVSDTREQLADAVARLMGDSADSLADNEHFASLQSERKDALVFACVDGPRLMSRLSPHLRGQEALVARALLDLDHLQAVSAALRTSEAGVEIRARMDLMDGHHNLAYGLIRTEPLTGRTLQHVPCDVAAVALLGLNPPDASAAESPAGDAGGARYLTAMDLGREVFANIEEAALFVMDAGATPDKGPPLPDVGLVIAVNDPAKSRQLWTQLLALPAMFGMPEVEAPREITIEGQPATEYRFPNAPPIVVAGMDEGFLIAGTRGAVTAAMRAEADRDSIAHDSAFKPMLASLSDSSSKAILVHVGRVLPIVSRLASGPEAQQLALAGSLLSDLRLSLVTHEAPTRFVVRAEATGLPDVPSLVKTFARLQRAGHPPTTQPVARAEP